MKRLLVSLLLGAAFGAAAQSTNSLSVTYTNGLSIRLPLNDAQYDQLQYIRRATGATNQPVAQWVTNYVQIDTTAAADAYTQLRRDRIAAAVQTAPDAVLSQIEAILPKQ